MSAEEICAIFTALHDGSVTAFSGDERRLRLTIECSYLAQRIDERFDHFYLELEAVAELTFKAWLQDDVTELWTNWNRIFASEPEFITAKNDSQNVVIWCVQNAACGSGWGELHLRCANAIIYDQKERLLLISELQQLAVDYWQDWTLRNKV